MTAARPIARLQRTSPEPFTARIPGSKSHTVRALVLAALRPGTTAIANGLHADDTLRLAAALSQFGGLAASATADGFAVVRQAGALAAPRAPLDLGGGGTPARFLLAFAALADGATTVDGGPRLRQRPMADGVAALRAVGVRVDELGAPGCLPLRVHGGPRARGPWRIGGAVSSQFGSAMLLLASQQPDGPVVVELDGEPVSAPYLALTAAVLRQGGIAAEGGSEGEKHFFVVRPGPVRAARFLVEPDASSAQYVLGMAALTATAVRVDGLRRDSPQGDAAFADLLARMGCRVAWDGARLELAGAPELTAIDVDCRDVPDLAPMLAVLAARARGRSRLARLAHLRAKESDRLAAIAAELQRLGQPCAIEGDALVIDGGAPVRPGLVHTRDDHRLAMAFAALGLVADGVAIEAPDVVRKSFPGFWDELARFCAHHERPA
jgi:3-phosphoshikimate 1-carboxyvinyltransferase